LRSISTEEADRHVSDPERETRGDQRYHGEYRDTEESSNSRHEKEFRFDKEKTTSPTNKMIKKVDLGAAAFYKVDNKPTTATIVSFRQNKNSFKKLFNDFHYLAPSPWLCSV
jgi:hypothetical protein